MKRALYWLNDYVHMARRGVAMYFYATPPAHYLDHVVEHVCPVIILPGILGTWAFMKPIADALSRDGHPVYVVPALGNNLIAIEDSARIVRALIDEKQIRNAVIVAHSKGGLIGKECLGFHNADARIAGMVSLATPYAGSALAHVVPHAAFRELTPRSGAVRRLRDNEHANERIISLIPEFDNHIWSEKGSWLDGALDNIIVPVKGHHAIISNAETLDAVRKAIVRIAR